MRVLRTKAHSTQHVSGLNAPALLTFSPSLGENLGLNLATTSHTRSLSAKDKFLFLLSLWRITVPLAVVYWAEYSLQSGVWSAIGFPVQSKEARTKFYSYANWAYQIGVFASRSSGTLFSLSLRTLWALPLLQALLLVLFTTDAITQTWFVHPPPSLVAAEAANAAQTHPRNSALSCP